jgi:type II secretory pathway pseudopilin PulG
MQIHPTPLRRLAGWTLAELMVAMAISSLLCGALIAGSLSLQKSFVASRHHILAQAEQMRLMDYMNLDLRRALSVSTGSGRLTVTIPDYYDSFGQPRDPEVKGGLAVYGPSPKTITYYKDGEVIYRSEGASRIALATDVSDFQLTFLDLGQSIQVSVTFIPRFQFSTKNQPNARDGTATFATTLLRNKRQG